MALFPVMDLLENSDSYHTFVVVVWHIIKGSPIVLGLVLSALLAALMSTIDTLINAASAIGIYDIYKPLIKPKADDKHYLKSCPAVFNFFYSHWFAFSCLVFSTKRHLNDHTL